MDEGATSASSDRCPSVPDPVRCVQSLAALPDARRAKALLGVERGYSIGSMAPTKAWKSDGAAELAGLPFAPGEAPFRVKGTAYRGHLEYVEQHVTGVYKVLLALASPQAVASRIPRLMGQYFDFGDTTIEQRAPSWIVATRSGLPAPIAPWYAAVSEGYSRVVLAQAGATEPQLDVVAVEPCGRHAGVDLVKLVLDLRWR